MARPALARFVTSTKAWLDHCRRAERLNLAGIYASDSPGQDGFVGAALALGATNKLAVGIAAALPTRSPLQTANAAAELAALNAPCRSCSQLATPRRRTSCTGGRTGRRSIAWATSIGASKRSCEGSVMRGSRSRRHTTALAGTDMA